MEVNEDSPGFIVGTKIDREDFKNRFKSISLSGEETEGVFGGAVFQGDGHANCGSGKHYLIVTNKR